MTDEAKLSEGPGQEQPRARAVRRQLDGPAGGRERALQVAGFQARTAEAEPVRGRVGAEADRLFEGRPRELVRIRILVRAPQAAPGGAGSRVELDRLLQLRERLTFGRDRGRHRTLLCSLFIDSHPARATLTRDVRVICDSVLSLRGRLHPLVVGLVEG